MSDVIRSSAARRASSSSVELRRREAGVCQWFHYEDDVSLSRAVRFMRELGVMHLRTGISWADFHRPGGKAWYDRQMDALREFEVLLSVWHTPPSRAEAPQCNAPPRRLDDYADFIEQVIDEYGTCFSHLELWNEPNNKYKWDFEQFDPDWSKFGAMIAAAAQRAQGKGVPTVLGGMIPIDHHWLRLMGSHGALEHIDVVAVHGFPGMWWPGRPCWDWHSHWKGWHDKFDSLAGVLGERPIWITETGLATFNLETGKRANDHEQIRRLEEVADAVGSPDRLDRSLMAERMYWYSLIDLDPRREAIEGFHVDENEYHMGLITHEGEPKPAFHRFRDLLRASNSHRGAVPRGRHRA